MSWQTPDGDPPPESAAQPPDAAAPEPDAETARFPVAETPPLEPAPPPTTEPAPPLEPDAPPPTADAPPPPAGIISAAPVGWTGSANDASSGPPADGPVVPWTAPAAAVATTVGPAAEGVVIARVFPRVVAYFVDSLLLGALGLAVGAPLGLYDADRDPTVTFLVGAVLVLVDLVYFVGLWTSGLQGTLGMRLLRLRVLDAVTAGTLPLNDALLRWIALSGAIGILALVPGLGSNIGLLGAVWVLVLLISTGTHPLRQGLHDRWARSVVVQPAPGGSGLAVATCLVLVVVFGFLLPVGVLALYGDQIRDILIEIGNSV